VKEAELSMLRRLGRPESSILIAQTNLANTYGALGRLEEAYSMLRDVYFGHAKLNGEEHEKALVAANNCAASLQCLSRFEEAKSLLRRTMPVARRVLGDSHENALRSRWIYALVLYKDPSATLDDLCEAVTTLEDAGRIARQVLGGAHPTTMGIEDDLRDARAALRARETPSPRVE